MVQIYRGILEQTVRISMRFRGSRTEVQPAAHPTYLEPFFCVKTD
jgi:hypothetical protein